MDVLVLGMVLLVLVFGAKDSILKAILGKKKKVSHISLKNENKVLHKSIGKICPFASSMG